MPTLSTSEHRALLDAQRELVAAGYHPSIAGRLVRRAAGVLRLQATDVGFGKVHQTRSLRRDLDPTIAPRQVIAGESCVRIQEIPGDETRMYEAIERYRGQGWNIIETARSQGFPSTRVVWACPPGRVPMEAQTQVLQSTPWGGPATLGEEFLNEVRRVGESRTVSAVRAAVSPWLWAFSLTSFLMGVANYRRVARMYRNWRAKRR